VAFRPPHSREKAPKCESCHRGSPNVVSVGPERLMWLCSACEYRDAYPAAPLIPAAPYFRRALPLQKETLF
jgi:ribosomal protein L37AE/L43A